ncbi:glycoside hydrolase family 43 protein [Paenibacillus sp. GCM10027626]|uniref:glycoside hydrolase family 43 protein n=1 Tax=Paenibacillus sp. GCM10027626 TaxID=3273411 RepID=UPI003626C5CA
MQQTADIQIRDPFILPIADERIYYMYGTTDKQPWGGKASGFDAYRSRDLQQWEGPFPVFRPEADFWADENFWAPEVHLYEGRYYMLASFKAEGRCRATQLLVADHPLGPFQPLTDEPITPHQWECLDGTLYRDEQGAPWIVYCREWLQTTDGEMYAQRLQPDLKAAAGEPIKLFSATEAPWVCITEFNGSRGYVTDGPYLFRSPQDELWMLWSSHGKDGYAIGLAKSASGSIQGPWVQENEPFFRKDGGHGMLFQTFEGEWRLSLHQPNTSPQERAAFLHAAWINDRLLLEVKKDD